MALFGKSRTERTVYFPWERKGVLARVLGAGARRRLFAYVALALAVFAFVLLDARNREQARVRQTRAALVRARTAIDAYRADHAGACPKDLRELSRTTLERPAYLASVPLDGWQRPLRFSCPGRDGLATYDLGSDGPDGEPWGLDRLQ
ncbi:MAG: type II secretion system protein GspG [Myxococcales bacterium]|nr:type II secretion system protein GspG [Myxococcales bacterium]